MTVEATVSAGPSPPSWPQVSMDDPLQRLRQFLDELKRTSFANFRPYNARYLLAIVRGERL